MGVEVMRGRGGSEDPGPLAGQRAVLKTRETV